MNIQSEYKIHTIGIALLILINITNNIPSSRMSFFSVILIYFILAMIITIQWLGIVRILKFAWKKFPEPHQVTNRLLYSGFQALCWAGLWMIPADYLITDFIHHLTWKISFLGSVRYFTNASIFCVTVLGISEAIYYYSKLRQNDLEKEEYKRIKLMSQYDSLKQQVNPHFLFNSLNTLSSLVRTDPVKAEKFIEEMSQVYRYILQNNNDQLTTLTKEIEFTESYLNLLKTRFGAGFIVKLNVLHSDKFYIPAFTLQLLVENAVKHNVVSLEQPLILEIFTQANDRLIVKNNLQKKAMPIPSAKIGLSNIITKYKYLNAPEVIIEESETDFIVDLPLLKSKS